MCSPVVVHKEDENDDKIDSCHQQIDANVQTTLHEYYEAQPVRFSDAQFAAVDAPTGISGNGKDAA